MGGGKKVVEKEGFRLGVEGRTYSRTQAWCLPNVEVISTLSVLSDQHR